MDVDDSTWMQRKIMIRSLQPLLNYANVDRVDSEVMLKRPSLALNCG